jgi:hypothetical protein
MADNQLDAFQTSFKGGNRSHLYEVQMGWPEIINNTRADDMDRFLIRAINLPPSQINPIRVPYRGRILKWPGDRVYFPWTFRVLDDQPESGSGTGAARSIWHGFQQWSNAINTHQTNESSDEWSRFTKDWTVQQVGYGSDAGNPPLKTVTLKDCWPTSVGPITMDSNAIDTLVEFTVTVEYSWFEPGL